MDETKNKSAEILVDETMILFKLRKSEKLFWRKAIQKFSVQLWTLLKSMPWSNPNLSLSNINNIPFNYERNPTVWAYIQFMHVAADKFCYDCK